MKEFHQRITIGELSGRGVLIYKFEHTPTNLAVVCQSCGSLWCKMEIETNERNGWSPISHLCEACGGGMLSSLLCEYRESSVPDELLLRELALYYESKERNKYAGSIYV